MSALSEGRPGGWLLILLLLQSIKKGNFNSFNTECLANNNCECQPRVTSNTGRSPNHLWRSVAHISYMQQREASRPASNTYSEEICLATGISNVHLRTVAVVLKNAKCSGKEMAYKLKGSWFLSRYKLAMWAERLGDTLPFLCERKAQN